MLMSQCRNGGFQVAGGGNVWGANSVLRLNYTCFAVLHNIDVESYVASSVGDRVRLLGETTAEAEAMEELEKKALKEEERRILDATQALPHVQHDLGLLGILEALAMATGQDTTVISLGGMRSAMCRHAGGIFYVRDTNGKVLETLTGKAAYQAKSRIGGAAGFKNKETRQASGAAPGQTKGSSNATVYRGVDYRGGWKLRIYTSMKLEADRDCQLTVDGTSDSLVCTVITHMGGSSFAPGRFDCTIDGNQASSLAAALTPDHSGHSPFVIALMKQMGRTSKDIVAIRFAQELSELPVAPVWFSPRVTRLSEWMPGCSHPKIVCERPRCANRNTGIVLCRQHRLDEIKADTGDREKCAVQKCMKWTVPRLRRCRACHDAKISPTEEVMCRCCSITYL